MLGVHIGAATGENSMEIPQNMKKGTAVWPSYATPKYLSKECESTHSKKQDAPLFTLAKMETT